MDIEQAVKFWAGKIQEETKRIGDVLVRKNSDYGCSVFYPLGVFSSAPADEQIRVRLDDKLKRLISLKHKAAKVTDESIDDTVQDVAGYLILLLAWRRETRKQRGVTNGKRGKQSEGSKVRQTKSRGRMAMVGDDSGREAVIPGRVSERRSRGEPAGGEGEGHDSTDADTSRDSHRRKSAGSESDMGSFADAGSGSTEN